MVCDKPRDKAWILAHFQPSGEKCHGSGTGEIKTAKKGTDHSEGPGEVWITVSKYRTKGEVVLSFHKWLPLMLFDNLSEDAGTRSESCSKSEAG